MFIFTFDFNISVNNFVCLPSLFGDEQITQLSTAVFKHQRQNKQMTCNLTMQNLALQALGLLCYTDPQKLSVISVYIDVHV